MSLSKIFTVVMVAGLALGFQAGNASAEGKTGYVNIAKVFEDYNKTKAFEAELQKEDEAKRDERAAMVDDIKKHRDELELLSSDKKAAKEKVIETKVQELQAFDRDWRLSLRRSRDEGLRDIIAEIEEVISTFGKDKGYDYIFNDRILLFKPDNQDITQKIVDLLNAKK